MTISVNEAKLELNLLNSYILDADQIDMFTHFTNAGFPSEIVYRLDELWEQTQIIGGKIIHIGKIIIGEILKFIEDNPNLAIGVALGAAIGALVGLVPYIGTLLSPLTIALGGIFGGAMGSKLDRNKKAANWFEEISQEAIVLAKKFFELLAAIFVALKDDFAKNVKG